jgi:UDP-glucose 4-epimerase
LNIVDRISKHILITGGRGFIGVNLVQYLAKNWQVDVFDNLGRASPTGWTEDCARMVHGDILDEGKLSSAMRGITHVVHLAAYGSVVESVDDPTTNFDINVRGTFNVLNAASKAGVRRFIFASTGGALIGDAVPPVHEDSVPKPISPYGSSKLCGEAYCHAFAKSYGLETVCLRFGNVYGPHSAHKKGAVTTFIKALMNDEPIVIYGDGSASRDYIHVDDLCAGIKAALEAPLAGGEVFHLASARETSVLQLAKGLCDIAGKPGHAINFKPARRGEVSRNFASYEKAKSVIGFDPKVLIEDGLPATWEWFLNHKEILLNVETTDS